MRADVLSCVTNVVQQTKCSILQHLFRAVAFCHLAQAHTRSCDLKDEKSVQATTPARFHGTPWSEDGAEVFSTAPSSGWKVCGEPQRVGYTYSRAKLPQTSSGSNLFSKRCSKAGTRWCYSSRKPHISHISFSLSQIYTNIWEVSFIKEKKRLHSNHIWRLTIK